MQGTEITDRIIEIAKLPTATERDLALRDLKSRTGATLASLRADLKRIQSGLAAMRAQGAAAPHIEALHRDGWFMILQGNKVWVGRLRNSRLNGHSVRKLEVITPADFVTWVQHMDPDAKPENSPGKMFLRDPETPRYDGTTIDPRAGLNADGKLNLWMGFDVEPQADRNRAKMFRDHVLKLCNDDQTLADYLLNWIAWGFQNPAKPIGVAPILIGEPGTGKGMLGNLLSAIWGSHGLTLRDKRSVVGDFNAHLAQCAFGFIDEALFVGDRSIGDRMKGLITEPTLQIEAKFQQRVEMTNMLKLMMATNHEHAMLIDPKDRRFVVIRVPDTMPLLGNPYWAEFADACHSVAGRSAILHDLLQRDLSEFHPGRDRPETAAYVGQKMASLKDDLLYWRTVAEEQTLTPGEITDISAGTDWPTATEPGDLRKEVLYRFYANFHRRHLRHGNPVPFDPFWKRALKLGIVASQRKHGQPRSAWVASYEKIAELLTQELGGGSLPAHPDDPSVPTVPPG